MKNPGDGLGDAATPAGPVEVAATAANPAPDPLPGDDGDSLPLPLRPDLVAAVDPRVPRVFRGGGWGRRVCPHPPRTPPPSRSGWRRSPSKRESGSRWRPDSRSNKKEKNAPAPRVIEVSKQNPRKRSDHRSTTRASLGTLRSRSRWRSPRTKSSSR